MLVSARQPASDEVHPGADEVYYDGVDGDCAGDSDFDADLDGYDSDSVPDATGAVGDDCDDAEASTYPGAPDTWYDGLDSDCAGDSDFDADGDGYDSADELTGDRRQWGRRGVYLDNTTVYANTAEFGGGIWIATGAETWLTGGSEV